MTTLRSVFCVGPPLRRCAHPPYPVNTLSARLCCYRLRQRNFTLGQPILIRHLLERTLTLEGAVCPCLAYRFSF